MAIFEGAGVALVTPFAKTGEINYEKLEELVEEQIAGGTDCIVAMVPPENPRRLRRRSTCRRSALSARP